MSAPEVRHATKADLGRVAEIFDTVIVDSYVSFEEERRSVGEWKRLLAEKSEDGLHQMMVLVVEGTVAGVAYSAPWRPKSGYWRSVETTIVLDPDYTGRGLGELLLTTLLESVSAAGAHRVIAVVALPNDASVALHHKLGFTDVGVLDEVGFKLGQYWSTLLMEKRL